MSVLIKKEELDVPAGVMLDAAYLLVANGIKHTIMDVNSEDETLTIVVEYELSQQSVINEIEQAIADYDSDDEDDDSEDDEDDDEDSEDDDE